MSIINNRWPYMGGQPTNQTQTSQTAPSTSTVQQQNSPQSSQEDTYQKAHPGGLALYDDSTLYGESSSELSLASLIQNSLWSIYQKELTQWNALASGGSPSALQPTQMPAQSTGSLSKAQGFSSSSLEKLEKVVDGLKGLKSNTLQEQQKSKASLQEGLAALTPAEQRLLYVLIVLELNRGGSLSSLKPSPYDNGASTQALTGNTNISSQPSDVSASSANGPVDESVVAELEKAQALFDKQDYGQANGSFSQILKENPSIAQKWPSIYYYLGVSAEYSGDLKLLNQAKDYYSSYLASAQPDADISAWVQKELAGGLPVQIKLKTAEEAFDKDDYDTAFQGYLEAYKLQPDLSTQWPAIFYKLGVSAEYAKNASFNKQAAGFYGQYLNSKNPDPQTKAWVSDEVAWLSAEPKAKALQEKAQNQFYKERNPHKAFLLLKTAVDRYPALTSRQPDVYYTLAMYAYSASDVTNAKKYLALADSAIKKLLKDNPDSEYAQYYSEQIEGFKHQLKDPIANWSTHVPSLVADKLHANAQGRFWLTELFQGMSSLWLSPPPQAKVEGRTWQKTSKSFIDTQSEYSTDKGLLTGMSAEQKGALEELSAQGDALEKELKKTQTERNQLAQESAKLDTQIKKLQPEIKASDLSQKDSNSLEQLQKQKQKIEEKLAENKERTQRLTHAQTENQTQQQELIKQIKETKTAKSTEVLPTNSQTESQEQSGVNSSVAAANTSTTVQQSAELAPAPAQQPALFSDNDKIADNKEDIQDKNNNEQPKINEDKANSVKNNLENVVDNAAPIESNYSTQLKAQEPISPNTSTESTPTKEVIKGSKASEKGSEKSGVAIEEEGATPGPGWWGFGTTQNHAQATGFQWNLSQGAEGKIENDWRGPFATTSNDDRTQQSVTVASGGKKATAYSVGVNVGVNIGNAEARTYDMIYGGDTGAGFGVGGMVGAQARVDVVDQTAGVSVSGVQVTIGHEKIDSLASASIQEQMAVGAQADSDVSSGIGIKGGKVDVALGGGAGAFVGAQQGVMVQGSVAGIGAIGMAQAWEGVGVKADAHAEIQGGKLSIGFGVGAALGGGGLCTTQRYYRPRSSGEGSKRGL